MTTKFQKMLEISNRIGKPPDFEFTPSEIFCEFEKIKLLKYIPQTKVKHETPVLLVPSLINKYYILDLLPGKSYIEFLVKNGFKVYLIDWGTVDNTDKFLTLEDYTQGFLDETVEKINEAENLAKLDDGV